MTSDVNYIDFFWFLNWSYKKLFSLLIKIWHSSLQRLSDSTGENHMKRKKRSLCNKMCGSRHESRGSWHVQQQQRFRLKKENLCSDTHVCCHRRFYMEQRGRAELLEIPGVAQDSEKSLTGLEL